MKKIIFILIGIVVGIAMSASFVRYRVMPFYYRVAEETGQKPFTTLVGDLHVTDMGDGIYMIKARENPKMTVMIGHYSGQNIMSEIEIMDGNRNSISCSDMDSNGEWDGWIFSNEKTICTYGRMSGYPDTVIVEGQESLVRIGGEYFPFQKMDGKNFIEKDGGLAELEYVQSRYFKIRESEPTKPILKTPVD